MDKETKEKAISHPSAINPNILSFKKVFLLNLVTLGAYTVYWGWKYWEIVKRVEGSKDHTNVRAFFITLTSFSLFPKILSLAHENGYKEKYNATALSLGLLVLTAINNRFDHPDLLIYIVVSIAIIFFITLTLSPVINAMNYYLAHNKEDSNKFNLKTNYPLIATMVFIFVLIAVLSFFAEA